MKNPLVLVLFLIIVLGGGYWLYTQNNEAGNNSAMEGLGSYEYVCNEGVEFTVTSASDMSTIRITPGANAKFAESTLTQVESSAGARYEGPNTVFVGAGEGVTMTMNGGTLYCDPKPNPDMAPWNWGDAGEGGGVKQDVSLIVSESIVGKWQSTQDAKSAREFKADGMFVDWYDNEMVDDGRWRAISGDSGIEKAFPLEKDAVYIELTTEHDYVDTLNFKLVKLTPETLELIYMERGGTLTYTSVQ